jgi:hypothetical protein
VLADMILFYATPDLRAELVNDETLLEMISAETAEIISTWTPSTSWERSIVSHGRHIQWLVWKTTNMHDDSMGEIYIDPDEVVAPWRINIETLPDYHQQLPAPTLLNDVD